jgi:ABC-2 type transport system permease protein
MTRVATHSWIMTTRNLAHVLRDPGEAVIGFGLPIMFVLVFGYVFGSGMAVPGDGNYREYLLPGVFVMTMLYGIGATATGMAYDLNRGVVDRFRSMPVARSALVAGRSAADLVRAVLEVAVLVACGVLVGWGWHRGLDDALLAIALILLLRFALTWMGVFLGLSVPNPDVVAVIVFPLAFPLTAISNVFVPPEAMPGWLGTIAEWNPLSATVSAARELFGNPALVADSWMAQNAMTMAVVWPVALTLIFAPLAVRRYTRLNR